MGPRTTISLGALGLALGSCTHYYKLDVHQVTALEVTSIAGLGAQRARGALCARGAVIDVRATTADGAQHEEGLPKRVDKTQFDPRLVALTASTGSFHDRAWNQPADPLALLGQPTVTVTATVVGNPAVTTTASFAPTWACDPPVAYVGGGDGHGGAFGAAAAAAGKPGANGGSGERGADGYATTVSIGWLARDGGERLAIADVMTRGLGESIFLLDQSTALKILANGGNGGGGGTGGFGGATDTGIAGPGGKGGDGGDGGDGGKVIVRYDAASPELQRLIVVENHGGHGGAHGYAGGGGMTIDAAATSTLGDVGDTGHVGRDGKPGPPPVFEPVPGLGAELTAMALHGARTPASAAAPPAPVLEPGHFERPMLHTDTDGGRQYEGDSELDLTTEGGAPIPHRANIHVESTRTSHGHFTIAFGEGVACKLDYHRPDGESRLLYVLDAPVVCTSPTLVFDVRTATLTIDPERDEIRMTADGTGSIAKSNAPRGPVAFHFAFTGQRR